MEVLLPTGLLTFWPLARMVLEVFPTAVGLQSLRSFTSSGRSRHGSFVAGRIADILAVGANGLGSLSHGSWSSKSSRSFTSSGRSRHGSFVADRIAYILAVGANGLGSLSLGSWS